MISAQVEDPNSAFWTGMARGIARRRAATEARWAEQRKAHAASGRAGRFFAYGTDFAGVRCLSERFHLCLRVGDGVLFESYDDEHVAALAHDIVRMACGGEALNYPKRGFCLAASPPTDLLEAMMRQAAGGDSAAGGGPRIRVVVKDSLELARVRSVLAQTLAHEMATDRRALGRRLVMEARELGGVVGNDDLFDELMARVDALDLERMLGDRLRTEGFAEPPGDGRARAAAAKKRGRAASASDDDDAVLPAPAGQWRSRAERAAKRAKPDA